MWFCRHELPPPPRDRAPTLGNSSCQHNRAAVTSVSRWQCAGKHLPHTKKGAARLAISRRHKALQGKRETFWSMGGGRAREMQGPLVGAHAEDGTPRETQPRALFSVAVVLGPFILKSCSVLWYQLRSSLKKKQVTSSMDPKWNGLSFPDCSFSFYCCPHEMKFRTDTHSLYTGLLGGVLRILEFGVKMADRHDLIPISATSCLWELEPGQANWVNFHHLLFQLRTRLPSWGLGE